MAKGRTNQPLTIWVASQFINSPPVQALIAQGHTVRDFGGTVPGMEPDLILHPVAHQWNSYMWDFLPAALAAARKRKKEAKG